jgi:hypothetical protein
MDPAVAHGLAAVISFNFNILEVMALCMIAAKWLGWQPENQLYRFVRMVLTPFFKVIGVVFKPILGQDRFENAAPLILLLILIPVERVWVFSLTSAG